MTLEARDRIQTFFSPEGPELLNKQAARATKLNSERLHMSICWTLGWKHECGSGHSLELRFTAHVPLMTESIDFMRHFKAVSDKQPCQTFRRCPLKLTSGYLCCVFKESVMLGVKNKTKQNLYSAQWHSVFRGDRKISAPINMISQSSVFWPFFSTTVSSLSFECMELQQDLGLEQMRG
ncbi:hypothetical protein INR49_017347 [Caranx melampygus]|nr:hypothetical protein INR49_017347 [Caranx melampygus]